MSSKRISVITGATAGIGFATAKALANHGDEIVMINRNAAKSEQAIANIRAKVPDAAISHFQADLAIQDEVRAVADAINKIYDRIDVLINNAGTWFSKHTYSPDGIEMQLAVNHVSPFLLIHLLLPRLLQSADGRIINVSSDTHFRGKIELDNLQLEKGYHGIKAYARSKLAMIMCTYTLSKHLETTNVTVNALQPGLVKTDIGHKHTIGLHSIAWWVRKLGGVSPEKGAATSIFLATSPAVKGVTGRYWDKCKTKPSSRRSYDAEMQAHIWEQTLAMAGISNFFPGKR